MKIRLSQAEAREQTRRDLLAAAERCFLEQGFHATSVAAIAAECGFTKGAVYGNFRSKDELFLAVYERQVERGVEQARRALAEDGAVGGLERLARERSDRDRRDQQWLAVFLEFWAHVVRHPQARERFVELHTRALAPLVEAARQWEAELDVELPVDAVSWVIAMNSLQLGIVLERLVQPDIVAPDLGRQLQRFLVEQMTRG